jgi:hypothetical protein
MLEPVSHRPGSGTALPGSLARPPESKRSDIVVAPAQGQPPALAPSDGTARTLVEIGSPGAARLPRGAHFVGVDGVTRVVR